MSDTKDGGPAFPRALSLIPSNGEIVWDQLGMSLRDYFAGQFLATIIISDPAGTDGSRIAKNCYAMADAMLAEREK